MVCIIFTFLLPSINILHSMRSFKFLDLHTISWKILQQHSKIIESWKTHFYPHVMINIKIIEITKERKRALSVIKLHCQSLSSTIEDESSALFQSLSDSLYKISCWQSPWSPSRLSWSPSLLIHWSYKSGKELFNLLTSTTENESSCFALLALKIMWSWIHIRGKHLSLFKITVSLAAILTSENDLRPRYS